MSTSISNNNNDNRDLCEHSRIRCYCKDCGNTPVYDRNTLPKYRGSTECNHGRVRIACKDCVGNFMCGDCSVCPHDRRRELCIECRNKEICVHKVMKRHCNLC